MAAINSILPSLDLPKLEDRRKAEGPDTGEGVSLRRPMHITNQKTPSLERERVQPDRLEEAVRFDFRIR